MARTSGLVTFEEFRAMWDASDRPRDDAAAGEMLDRSSNQRRGWIVWEGAAAETILDSNAVRRRGWAEWPNA